MDQSEFELPRLTLEPEARSTWHSVPCTRQEKGPGSVSCPGQAKGQGSVSSIRQVRGPGPVSCTGRIKRPGSVSCPGWVKGQGSVSCPGWVRGQGSVSCPGRVKGLGSVSHMGRLKEAWALSPVLGRSQQVKNHLPHGPLGLWTAASILFSVSLLLGWSLIFYSTPEGVTFTTPPWERASGRETRVCGGGRLFQ